MNIWLMWLLIWAGICCVMGIWWAASDRHDD
jgi:hypothetical protein